MTGYTLFSQLIGRFPQLHCYRRFGSLSARTLLYQQAELSHLEAELRLIAAADEQDPHTKGFDQSWWKLSRVTGDFGACYQREKVAEAQEKLKEYRSQSICATPECGLNPTD